MAGVPGRARPRPGRSRRPSQPALHDRDGWIDFGAGGGSYYYSRTAMTATGSLTIDGRALPVDGRGLVRPPVGRLHLGRRRRLGLVRRQPRGRDGPDAVARPRRGRHLSARLRDAGRRRRPGPSPARGGVHRRGRRALAQPGDRRGLSRPAGPSRSRRRRSRSCWSRRSRPRSSTRGRRRASSTGRGRSESGRRAAAIDARRGGVRGADRLRADAAPRPDRKRYLIAL